MSQGKFNRVHQPDIGNGKPVQLSAISKEHGIAGIVPRMMISPSLTAPKRLPISPASWHMQNYRPVSPPFPAHPHKSTSGNLPKTPCVFSRVLLADLMRGWTIGCGKKIPDCKAIKGHYLASKAGGSRQTGLYLGPFSMRNQSEPDTGFSGKRQDPETAIRGLFRRIFPQGIGLPWGESGNTHPQLNKGHTFPGPKRPRIGYPWIPFPGSTGNGVHANGTNGISELFLKIGQNKGHFNLHYSGPVRAPVFGRCWSTWQRAGRPL